VVGDADMNFKLNMNGDPMEMLYGDARRLTKAVHDLEDAIRMSFPNGRNYLHLDDPLGYEYRQDREKWSEMLMALKKIEATVNEFAEEIARQRP
jgi:hypothetical protein